LRTWSVCDATDIIKNVTKELKGFHRMASRDVPNTFTVAGGGVQLHTGTTLKKM